MPPRSRHDETGFGTSGRSRSYASVNSKDSLVEHMLGRSAGPASGPSLLDNSTFGPRPTLSYAGGVSLPPRITENVRVSSQGEVWESHKRSRSEKRDTRAALRDLDRISKAFDKERDFWGIGSTRGKKAGGKSKARGPVSSLPAHERAKDDDAIGEADSSKLALNSATGEMVFSYAGNDCPGTRATQGIELAEGTTKWYQCVVAAKRASYRTPRAR